MGIFFDDKRMKKIKGSKIYQKTIGFSRCFRIEYTWCLQIHSRSRISYQPLLTVKPSKMMISRLKILVHIYVEWVLYVVNRVERKTKQREFFNYYHKITWNHMRDGNMYILSKKWLKKLFLKIAFFFLTLPACF